MVLHCTSDEWLILSVQLSILAADSLPSTHFVWYCTLYISMLGSVKLCVVLLKIGDMSVASDFQVNSHISR